MIYKKVTPCKYLQPFVREFWLLEFEEKDIPYTQQVIPFSWFELYFTFEKSDFLDSRKLIESAYTGQFSKPFYIQYNRPAQVIGVSFQPWAGNLLYGIPANEFTNSNVKLAALYPYLKLLDEMALAQTEMEVFAFLESYIMDKVKNYSGRLCSTICFAKRHRTRNIK